jgi:TPR repeat protein
MGCVISQSQFILGKNAAKTLFEEGCRLYREKHFAEAANRWSQAALLQHGPSHAFLSNMLFEGRKGVPSDETRAFVFASAGAALNCSDSKGGLALCLLYQPGIIQNLRRNDDQCLALANESAATGSPFGLYVLAKLNAYGLGVTQNDATAMILFEKAAEAGHAASMCEVAYRLRTGQHSDFKTIASLLLRAADQGHALAQCNLGLMFKHGEWFGVDKKRARECFQLAVEQDNSLGKGLLRILEKEMSKRR